MSSDLPARRPNPKNSWLRRLISVRRVAQIGFGAALYLAVSMLGIGLGWVILAASALGIVLGKFFCRWMCPMGAVMETMLGSGGDEDGRQKSLYLYFKLGCPIAWAGGLLNKVSLLRVKVDPDRCTGCSRCDKACYVSQLSAGNSLHLAGKLNASTHYSCSRCLQCVQACPTGALSIGALGRRTIAAGPGRADPKPAVEARTP
ncbi:MAG TPA: 4Fe-4S binding protein [Myxococcales bacterium]|jgi:polyferredoxin